MSDPTPPSPLPWYAISRNEYGGAPEVTFAVPPSVLTPTQIRGAGLLEHLREEKGLRKLELAIERSLAGSIPVETWWEGWNNGGGAGIDVDRRGVVSFGNQYDEMNEQYPDESFEMPLSEFLPLWRDWVASRRLYNSLIEKHGTPSGLGWGFDLPRQFWPAHYPPRDEA